MERGGIFQCEGLMMMLTIKNDRKWPRKERNRPVSSYFTCKVDNEIIKHVIGG